MDEVLEYLTKIPAWFFATCEGDQPHVRPWSFAAIDNGRLVFCTATNKDVYAQLKANPKFEGSGWHPGEPWIVITGEAEMDYEVSEATRIEGYEHMTGLGEHYEGPNDPRLTFFGIRNGVAKIADIDGSERLIQL